MSHAGGRYDRLFAKLESLTELEVMGAWFSEAPWSVCVWVPMGRLGNLGRAHLLGNPGSSVP